MAASGKRKPSSFAAAVLFPIILYCIPLSIFLLHPSSDLLRDETAKVRAALLSRGNYSAMIPDLVSKLLHFYPVGAEEAITVFVPSDDTEYDWCETERPEVRVLTGRVDRESFGPGGLSHGSVLQARDGGGSPIWVRDWHKYDDVRRLVVDWGLYDDGRRLVVHGMRGRLVRPRRWVRIVPGWLVIKGLIVEKRGPRDPRCPDPDPDMMPKGKEEETYRSKYVRRVDGGPLPALLHNGPVPAFHCDRKNCY